MNLVPHPNLNKKAGSGSLLKPVRIHNTELNFRHFANIKKPVKRSDAFPDTSALVAGRDTSTETRHVSLGHRTEQFQVRLLDPDLRGIRIIVSCGSMAQKRKKKFPFLELTNLRSVNNKTLACIWIRITGLKHFLNGGGGGVNIKFI
jgi:hypothetical protein